MIWERSAAVRPPTYPARPLNGGALELAPAKSGRWFYEPKYNGWRALVHAPTSSMFNRYGQPLSIGAEFGRALERLREVALGSEGIEWFDCEALDRRHALGRGALLVFDYIGLSATRSQTWHTRKEILAQTLPMHDFRNVPLPESLGTVQAHDPDQLAPQELYEQLHRLNARWSCRFYEGVVAKRLTDPYPLQLRSPHEEYAGWVKHRWADPR